MKKIICYTIFGTEEFYKNGLISNLDIIKNLFPDFIVRIYADSSMPIDFLRNLDGTNIELILKKLEYPYNGLLWRFLPLSEPNQIVIVRDCDQRLTERDRWVYDDFISSSRNYFVVRDLPGCKSPLMAGGWGFKTGFKTINVEKLWASWRETQHILPGGYLWDQNFLATKIYPLIRKDLITYTEHVIYEGETDIRRIPVPRKIDNNLSQEITFYSSDIDDEDELKTVSAHGIAGLSMNQYRKEFIQEAQRVVNITKPWDNWVDNRSYNFNHDLNFTSNKIKIYYPRHKHSVTIINQFIFFCDIITKIIIKDKNITDYVIYRLKKIFFLKFMAKENKEPPFPYR